MWGHSGAPGFFVAIRPPRSETRRYRWTRSPPWYRHEILCSGDHGTESHVPGSTVVTVGDEESAEILVSNSETTGISHQRSLIAPGVLLAAAGWVVWHPVETNPLSAVLIASVVLGLTVWGWRRTPPHHGVAWLTSAAGASLLFAAGMAGWDPAAAVTELALIVAVAALVWLASRQAPPEQWPAVLAVVISGLALWGLRQVGGGPEYAASVLEQLPEHIHEAAAERLASRRAFASQPLPSHLAVLFASALPLLLDRLRRRWAAVPWAVASVLCIMGLLLTRSPIGTVLALVACTALAFARYRRRMVWVVLLLALVLTLVVIGRGDVMDLDPVRLRLDNWRTALWVWSTAPASGVGTAGFAQAAQAVPFEVGNRPMHAHSLPLEWLAEFGPVGLMASVFLAALLWRLMRSLWPHRPDLAVAVAVVPAHNMLDFSLYGSGVALPWAVLVGWGVALCRPEPKPGRGGAGRTVLVLVTSAMLVLTVLHATSAIVEVAAAQSEDVADRYSGAAEARRLAPWRVDPLGLMAGASLDSGDPELVAEALSELERARWLRPRSSALAGLRARLAVALGEIPTAASEAWRSRHDNPSSEVAVDFANDFFMRLDRGAQVEER